VRCVGIVQVGCIIDWCRVLVVVAFRARFSAVNKVVLGSGLMKGLSVLSAAGPGIEVKKPSEEEIAGCQRWSTWGCGVSKFPWTYSYQETAYIIAGNVIQQPDHYLTQL